MQPRPDSRPAPSTVPATDVAPDYPEIAAAALPSGWVALSPLAEGAAELHALLQRHEVVAHGRASTTRTAVEADLSPVGLQTRRHLLLRDAQGGARAWATIYDRAAGRVLVSVTVDPGLDPGTADQVADALFGWTQRAARDLAFDRGLDLTQIDSGAFDEDGRQQRWLTQAGFAQVRTWLQMSRPATSTDADPAARPTLDPAVVVRRVHQEGDGMPDHLDVVTVHDVLEESFTDHFNYHPETFDEFSLRLREDPGHRWDHWWIAELVDAPHAAPRTAGVLVGTASPGGEGSPDGSYVAYLGVLRLARGRGVARSLLTAVITDAAERGRDRVGLEVDADSPTGAVDLYTSMGFRTSYLTQSWHRDLPVGAPGGEIGRSKVPSKDEGRTPH
ncbi:MAG: GNAT family N-acetyltransferase [Cellulomonas sp.]|nr:GNAT family N-acetyltransferase [Cellulomonas sp.]